MQIDSEITFRKLEIFITFMAQGNIARTAELLGLSNVSVHRALHTLEEGVRCPLFIHRGRNLVALPAARTLLQYSQQVIQIMARGLEETQKVAGISQGRLRIGTLYSLTLETVPRLMMGLKLRRPELENSLTMGSNRTLLAMLDDDTLDAVLVSLSPEAIDQSRLEILPLFEDDLCLAASTKLAPAGTKPVDLRACRQQKFISLTEGFATSAGFQEAFHVAGFTPQIVTRVNDIFSMLSLVRAGVGFALLPARMRKVYENDVQLLKLAEPFQVRQLIAIVFARSREHDPNLLALVAEGRMYARACAEQVKIVGE